MSVSRFRRLLRVYSLQEHQSAIGLAQRLQDVSRAEAQYDKLENYLQLYLDAPIPNDIHQIKQMAFIRQNLRSAMEQQSHRVHVAQANADQARAVWLMRHRDSQVLTKLIERRQADELVIENRRQQQEQDVWATRRAFERTQANDNV